MTLSGCRQPTTGCGIAAANIGKLFDPFYSTKFAGRGLGLSVVQGIVTKYGGNLTVESEPDRGSVFRIFLPITTTTVAPPPVLTVPLLQRVEPGTVLVVDDDPFNRLAVERLFEMKSVNVVCAKGGAEAVAIVKDAKHDLKLILMDINMPSMNGLKCTEILMEFWRESLLQPIPIIALSGCTSDLEKKACIDVGMYEFISKPIKLHTIDYLINQYL